MQRLIGSHLCAGLCWCSTFSRDECPDCIGREQWYQFQITTKNTGVQPLTDIKGRVIWPIEARQIRMTTNEWGLESLAPGEVSVQKLDFVSYDDLKDLPEVLLRVDTKEQDRLFRQPIDPLVLKSKSKPSSNADCSRDPTGFSPVDKPLVFQHVVYDDGALKCMGLVQQRKDSLADDRWNRAAVARPRGHNNLYLELQMIGTYTKEGLDNIGLASQSGEAHLGEDTIETEESQE